MTMLDSLKQALKDLKPGEKAEILQWIARDLGNAFPGIEQRIDVQGGDACIVRTRIPVWGLVHYRQLGMTDADLLHNYPTLRAEDLVHAWAYYDAHREEIDQRIREDEAA
jgi:uncharacterized protein (DUF433 family)